MKIQERLKLIKISFIAIFFLNSSILLSQTTLVKKAIIETSEFAIKKTSLGLEKKAIGELLLHYSEIYVKNGFGKRTRIQSKSIQNFLKETYHLRGKEELIKVGNKLSTLDQSNLTSIKGFLAEEMHHNELLKIDGVENIQIGLKSKTTDFVRKAQGNYIAQNLADKKDLYIHKVIELDIVAKKNNAKFIIEVKNIDSPFTKNRFQKYMSQLVKQKAYAKENGIKNVFWSNIGVGKLSPEQIKKVNELGVEVFQNGSISPMVNAKINMIQMKRVINNL